MIFFKSEKNIISPNVSNGIQILKWFLYCYLNIVEYDS